MNQDQPNRPKHNPKTFFDGVLLRFTDPPGGAPLDDPEVQARERRGRPASSTESAPPEENTPTKE
jgi:hypothetical protein